jgi:hypothetical protein
MKAQDIITAALAHTYEEAEKDALDRNLSIPLINLGLAELTDAENLFRVNDPAYDPSASAADISAGRAVTTLKEPVSVTKPEDNVPYDYHITTILLPLWLAWKVFEGLDDINRSQYYRGLYEQKRADLIPATFEMMHDYNGTESRVI